MVIPASETHQPGRAHAQWMALDLDGKRERLLNTAGDVFARQGLDAPMADVADAAGAGVASIYRRFPSKRDLLAALVVRRMDQIALAARAARRDQRGPWTAMVDMLHTLVEGQAADDFLGDARAAVATHADVIAATDRATEALDRVMAAAREEGRLRSDATTLDLRLLFAATRAARQVEPEHWPRILQLLIDALDSQPRSYEAPTPPRR
jgi:AcrR family transcriptional regulator